MERSTGGSRPIKSRLRSRGAYGGQKPCCASYAADGLTGETVAEAKKGIGDYLRYFNEERPTRALTALRPMTYTTDESH